MPNPFIYDIEPPTYTAFDVPGTTPCNFVSGHLGTCEIVDSQRFMITFDEDSTETRITGTTTANPFQNP
jgi:hypothetical protein